MLNKNNIRELAYVIKIDDIKPIAGRDRVECAVVGGWTIMVRKNQFHAGDPGIYFEIDSQVPEKEPFMFLEAKHFKIKTQKYKTPDGQFWSQGLLMSAEDFGWEIINGKAIKDNNNQIHSFDDESRFLTAELGVVYATAKDNVRKAASADKYKKMAARHGKLFSCQPFCWLMKRNWGKKLLFFFFGRKKDKRTEWPNHICSKTDVERIQNMIYILNDKQPYIATEKVDGSSCTVTAERKKFGKISYKVCSRNVVFENENQECFYDKNIYFEIYHKYDLKNKITKILNDYNLSNIALQMEIFGPLVQKRDYSLKEREARIFHIVSNGQKFPMDKVVEICEKYNLPHVPIINDNFILPDTLEELQEYVESQMSLIDGKEKEGIVFYDKATGQQYFKFVSPSFLLKYHG